MDPVTKALLRGYIKSITFESNVNDPVTISEPFAESPPGLTDKAMAAIRPKFTIQVWDQKPLVIAPGGEPSRETRTGIKVGGIVAGVAIGGLLLASLTRK